MVIVYSDFVLTIGDISLFLGIQRKGNYNNQSCTVPW